MSSCKLDFFIGDVHERDLEEDAVFALSPSDQRMQPKSMPYLHVCVEKQVIITIQNPLEQITNTPAKISI